MVSSSSNDLLFKEKAWKAAKGINDERSNAGPYHMMPIKVGGLFIKRLSWCHSRRLESKHVC
ncbi:unnamed protein product [Heligmosomoides polygyrus]|uniref:Uncharacterized protein n=1 Tax=Heligmosomoides polygyrus TaxID=6339 RepID=A0A3P8D9W4_HELPZ|nr:unnamed protein product [Heligmosomoides polygyrus]